MLRYKLIITYNADPVRDPRFRIQKIQVQESKRPLGIPKGPLQDLEKQLGPKTIASAPETISYDRNFFKEAFSKTFNKKLL